SCTTLTSATNANTNRPTASSTAMSRPTEIANAAPIIAKPIRTLRGSGCGSPRPFTPTVSHAESRSEFGQVFAANGSHIGHRRVTRAPYVQRVLENEGDVT